jgi:hypothetical protein
MRPLEKCLKLQLQSQFFDFLPYKAFVLQIPFCSHVYYRILQQGNTPACIRDLSVCIYVTADRYPTRMFLSLLGSFLNRPDKPAIKSDQVTVDTNPLLI